MTEKKESKTPFEVEFEELTAAPPLKPGTPVIAWNPYGHSLTDKGGTFLKKGFVVRKRAEKYEVCLETDPGHVNHRCISRDDIYTTEETSELSRRVFDEFQKKIVHFNELGEKLFRSITTWREQA